MGIYQIIVRHGNFVNTAREWCGSREEAVEKAKEYCDWLGCVEWQIKKLDFSFDRH